jgi:decaprenylphospho-beta-D-erythro-pentofuranosid-2-ulose 2-reductase
MTSPETFSAVSPLHSFKRIVIFGATSGIAIATAQALAGQGITITLVGRSAEKLKTLSQDLSVRQATVSTELFDFCNIDAIPDFINKMFNDEPVDLVLVAHGNLTSETTPQGRLNLVTTNFLSTALITEQCAQLMAKQSIKGVVGVISSVAGDRGRRKKYWYCATKGALTTFLSGLRSEYSSSNVHILTIKPGFVDTPMTADMRKGILFAQPSRVAQDIVRAAVKRRNVIYTPWFWEIIMKILGLIPEVLFKRLPV